MKSIVNTEQILIISYPKLMISTRGTIILMIADKKGTILNLSNHSLGKYHETWNMDELNDFVGSVTLSNS